MQGESLLSGRARIDRRKARRTALPPELTSFIGREQEIAEVKSLLGDRRLLTLYGSGGSGKTRLALAVAQDLVEGYEDGVWWVDLAPIFDSDLVPQTVGSALGLREAPHLSPTETLVEYLENRRVLLVLDNCEHLVGACAEIAESLLKACPDLEILATSREPLRVAGESCLTVPSLSRPDPRALPPAGELARYEAVRLFVERSRAVDAGFELTEHNALAVARLCCKLDGIPLAIELAAARVRALSVEQISERLADPLSLLTRGERSAAARHRTLRATLDWSHDLLGEPERALFRRLSVFAGGWDLEAAEALGAGEPVRAGEVLDLLSALVDKSLVGVEAEADGAPRYRMLEPVRQFAREKLERGGEAPRSRLRHAEHYLAIAERAEPELLGADQGQWLRRLRTEFANLREAHTWSLEPGEEEERARLRLRLPAALWRFWGGQRFEEGKRWLQTALERDTGAFPAVRAKALDGFGFILLFQQDYERAIVAIEEAISLYEGLGDRSGAALALGNLGYAVLHGGYYERVPTFVAEAEASMMGDLDAHARAYLSITAATATIGQGDLDSAVARLEECLAMCRELGDRRNTSMTMFILGMVEVKRGELERGATLLDEGSRISRELGDKLGAAYFALGLGKLNALWGRPLRAARVWGAAEALRERMGMSLSKFDLAASGYEQDLAAVRSTLDGASFHEAWAEGRSMSFERIIDHALEGPTPDDREVRTEVVSPTRPPAERPTDGRAECRHNLPESRGGFVGREREMAEIRLALPNTRDLSSLVDPTAERAEVVAGTPAPEAASLRVFALGAARVEKDGRPLDSADWVQKPRELLYYLLAHPPRTKEQIGLALWPEASTSRLRSSFHDTLYRLRRALGGKEWVSFSKGRYTFDRSLAYSYDVEAFGEGLSEARRVASGAPDEAIRRLQEAVDLYRGDFLEDFAEADWAMDRQDELRREYGEALLLLARLLSEQDRYAEAAHAYRKAIAHDGFMEEAHRGVMRSHAALGERSRALKHYEELVGLLDEQLYASPAPETTELYESLR